MAFETCVEMPRVPVLCNSLCDTEAAARSVAMGRIELAVCADCSLMYNRAFDPSLVDYRAQYDASLHFSTAFRDYAQELGRRLVETYAIRRGVIVEIGCGKGDFLSLICRLSDSRGFGFDSTYQGELSGGIGGLIEIRESGEWVDGVKKAADLICCRHVLEHLAVPEEFLRILKAVFCRDAAPVVYLEVPNASWILETGSIWDIIYEHFTYFTDVSLGHLTSRVGLKSLQTAAVFGGQFLSVDARSADPVVGPVDPAALARTRRLATRLATELARVVERWEERLLRARHEGRKVVVWGCGSKGTTFVNLVSGARHVGCIVDVNPRKAGRYVPGTGHQILAPEDVAPSDVDTVLVMNTNYRYEIRDRARELGWSADFWGI